MPGMNNGLDPSDPSVVAAFHAALLHQGIIVLLVFALLSVAWVSVRAQPHVLAFLAGGYLALTRVPAAAEAAVPAPTKTKMPNGWRERLTPAAVRRSLAAAQASPAASVILAQYGSSSGS